jgi:argininosuccinate lyase
MGRAVHRQVTSQFHSWSCKNLTEEFDLGKTDPLMTMYNESLSYDKRMWAQDIQGSQAYAKALCMKGILTEEERDKMMEGLTKVQLLSDNYSSTASKR